MKMAWLGFCLYGAINSGCASSETQSRVATGHTVRPDCSGRVDKTLCSMEEEIFLAMNDLRASQGLPWLLWNNSLSNVARRWSCEMGQSPTQKLTHDGWESRIAASGLTPGGENLAKLTGNPSVASGRAMFEMWKGSPSHYKNMIENRFHVVGVGICINANLMFGTQHFSFD